MKKLLALVLVRSRVSAALVAYVHSTEPAWYVRLRYPLRYEAIVRGHARNYRLDPALLAGVIYQESKFHAARALELRRDRPDAAAARTRRRGSPSTPGGSKFRVSDLDDPEINVRYGSWYLRHLLDKYGDERTALAAYNAGQAERRHAGGARGGGSPSPRRRQLRQARRAPEDALSAWLRQTARFVKVTLDRQHE